jgi:6-phosphogluconate dehydrogenase
MQLGFVGLGKMGLNMVTRLLQGGHRVTAFDPSAAASRDAVKSGATAIESLEALIQALAPPRAIWLMIPAGDPTETTISRLSALMKAGDIIIDGGNTNYHDDVRRAATLKSSGIQYVDVGTSGGIWGLSVGYCLMIGGEAETCEYLEPIFRTLAPERGYARMGGVGSGHFVKMVHNGIEYGLMQAYAEGFELMHKSGMDLDLATIANLWMRGSVVRSWLLELAAAALVADPNLDGLQAYVQDSGEGRWTIEEGLERSVPLPVITAALYTRFRSRDANPFADRLLAALRQQFGGHAVKTPS